MTQNQITIGRITTLDRLVEYLKGLARRMKNTAKIGQLEGNLKTYGN